jgi:hypothetical protein
MATRKKAPARITLRTVLEHMQTQHQEVLGEFANVRREMTGMERRLTRQIDRIDERLDDIEVVQIPMLKKAVGAR